MNFIDLLVPCGALALSGLAYAYAMWERRRLRVGRVERQPATKEAPHPPRTVDMVMGDLHSHAGRAWRGMRIEPGSTEFGRVSGHFIVGEDGQIHALDDLSSIPPNPKVKG